MQHPLWAKREQTRHFRQRRDRLWAALFVRYFAALLLVGTVLLSITELPAPVLTSLGCAAFVYAIAASRWQADRRAR